MNNTSPPEVEEQGNGFPALVFIVPGILFICILVLSGSGIQLPDIADIGLMLFCAAELAWLLGLYDLMREGRMATPEKILWLIMMIFLNVLGTIFYALLKGRYLQAESAPTPGE